LKSKAPCDERTTLYGHAAVNRIFIGMAAELLMTGTQREVTEIDASCISRVFVPPETQAPRRGSLT
jgi:hypothetical protein